MLKIQEINNKNEWDGFLDQNGVTYYPLFQSWNWGELQQHLGFFILRLGVFREEKLVAICQLVEIKAKRGRYFHLRHGPVMALFDQSVFQYLIEHVKSLAKQRKAWFVRMSPLVKKEFVDYGMIKKMGFVNAPIHNMDAEVCWVLDITKSEEEILRGMRKTHRYLIKKAMEIKDLEIVVTTKISALSQFMPIYRQLARRKHFVAHKGIPEELEIFGKEHQAVLFLAKYQEIVIGGSIILFVGNTGIYHHSAFDPSYNHLPVSYLLQWQAIVEAKKRGKLFYNFWGIARPGDKKHPWQGHTLFKRGFGGEMMEFLHAQDLSVSLKYWFTYLVEYGFKKKKGY